MEIQRTLQRLLNREDLQTAEMREVMHAIMSGACTAAQIAGFLIALRMKGESVEEIAAAAEIMRKLSARVEVRPDHLLDTCGTGGDGAGTFNISTTAALVAAAAGARVAKHGNRSVSGKSGSADVLEAAGVKLELTPAQVAECINRIGIGFMFAPAHHGAMKHAIGPRRELGVRTLFNLLGPLTNPAGATCQLIGVYSDAWVEKIAEVLHNLGSRHVMVVHAEDGLDEISINAPTSVAELVEGEIRRYRLTPEQYGLQRADLKAITAESVQDSLHIMQDVLNNKSGPARDVVLLNAAAALYTAGITENLENGMEHARQAIAGGAARDKLEQLIAFTRSFR
ncbi:MAG: anthranilate phosphoribosyltransferase, partial [Gammaproteobacteria bacterium]